MPNSELIPFTYEKFVLDEQFCSRNSEIKTVLKYINNHKNILLYSKRRYGKSSLIQEIFKNHLTKNHITIYVDMFDIVNAQDFAFKLYKAISKSLPFDFKESLLKLKELFNRATFSGTLNQDGQIEIRPALSSKDYDELMEDVFNSLNKLSKQYNVVVAIDEFQQIADIKDKKIDATIREYIQKQTNISYIFCGSKKHLLTNLFTSHKAPLYEMANHFELKPIELNLFYDFVKKKMNKSISLDDFTYLYDLVEGESKLIQQICFHLYNKPTISKVSINEVLEFLVDEKEGSFRTIYDLIGSRGNKITLKIIASTNGVSIYSKDVLENYSLTKQSINASVKRLISQEIIDREDDRFYFTDKLFGIWLRRL